MTRFEAGDLDEEEEEEEGGGSGGTGVRGGGELAPRMAEEARARRKTREAATGSILSDVAEELVMEFGRHLYQPLAVPEAKIPRTLKCPNLEHDNLVLYHFSSC